MGILVLAALRGRLLGTRRSLGVVLVWGLCGWAAGAALALILARSRYALIPGSLLDPSLLRQGVLEVATVHRDFNDD
jgi:hypothetical protein